MTRPMGRAERALVVVIIAEAAALAGVTVWRQRSLRCALRETAVQIARAEVAAIVADARAQKTCWEIRHADHVAFWLRGDYFGSLRATLPDGTHPPAGSMIVCGTCGGRVNPTVRHRADTDERCQP